MKEYGKEVKIFRSDSETVLVQGDRGRYLEENSYFHEQSTPEAHYQNFVEIVRDGIKNTFVWVNICYDIYKDHPHSPCQATLEAVSIALTSYRQKGFDPYVEAKSGPVINAKSITANAVFTTPNRNQQGANKKHFRPSRDASGKFQKSFRPPNSAPATAPNSNANDRGSATSEAQQSNQSPLRCTRCWQAETHSYRFCTENKCSCGSNLAPGQVICFNYENHPTSMRFLHKMPKFIETALQAYKNSKGHSTPSGAFLHLFPW